MISFQIESDAGHLRVGTGGAVLRIPAGKLEGDIDVLILDSLESDELPIDAEDLFDISGSFYIYDKSCGEDTVVVSLSGYHAIFRLPQDKNGCLVFVRTDGGKDD